jgi:hypothetical protein
MVSRSGEGVSGLGRVFLIKGRGGCCFVVIEIRQCDSYISVYTGT